MGVEIRLNGERSGELPEHIKWNDVRGIDKATRHNRAFLAQLRGKVLGDAYYHPDYVDFKVARPGASFSAQQARDNGLISNRKP